MLVSKAALRAKLSEVLNAHRVGDTLEGEEAKFVREMLNRHPRAEQKVGCGVRRLYVGEGFKRGARCFWLERLDGSRTDFSFLKCLSAPTAYAVVCKAARQAILGQILAYKEEFFASARRRDEPARCALTQEPVAEDYCHVDHVIPFDALLREFLRVEGLRAPEIEILGTGDGEQVKRFADEVLAQRWRTFHRDRAVLRVTTPKANLQRPRPRGATGADV
jgi:hypothetical protein